MSSRYIPDSTPANKSGDTGSRYIPESTPAGKSDYDALMRERPRKLNEADSEYRKADSDARCGRCLHMFRRVLDGFAVCEIVRPDDDSSIKADSVCRFYTEDGDTFPLL